VASRKAYFSTLKMEVIYFSEMSVDFPRTTRRYIPEEGTLHNHRCENLKSYILAGVCGYWNKLIKKLQEE
jgi:hypothetical protein